MNERRRHSPVLLLLAAACLPLLMPHLASAQQAASTQKAPPPGAASATPCTDFPPTPRLEDTKDVDALETFLNRNYEIAKECAQETIKGIDLVRSGEKSWDFADQKITQQIDQGRELVQVIQYNLMPKLEKLIGDIESSAGSQARFVRDPAEQAKRKDALLKKADRFKTVAKELTTRSAELAKQATAMEGERPRLAQLMREKEWDKILERVEKISAAISEQAKVLQKRLQDLGTEPQPKGGVNP